MPQPSQDPSQPASLEADVQSTLSAAVDAAEAVTLTFDGAGGRTSRRATIKAVTWTDIHFIVSAADANVLADASIGPEMCPVIVACRLNGSEVVFFTTLPELETQETPSSDDPDNPELPPAADDPCVEIALPLPEQLVITRRRQSFRIAVASEDQLQLRLWRIEEHAILRDCPPPSRSFRAELYDLSASGVRAMLWARPIAAMQLKLGQRFRIEIKSADHKSTDAPMVFDARLRHPRASGRDDPFAFCDFEFDERQDDIEGRRNRQRLDALLARLQQAAARRQTPAK